MVRVQVGHMLLSFKQASNGQHKGRRQSQAVFVLAIMLVGFFLRAYPFLPVSLWLDEAVEFHVANRPLSEVVLADRNQTHDPPLYSLILSSWMKIGKSDVFLKLPSAFFSVLAIAVMYAFGKYSGNVWTGYLAALVTAVASRSVYFGQEVNQYGLVLLVAVLCPLLLERYFSAPSPGRLLGFVLVAVFAILTHYQLVVYLIGIVVVGSFYVFAQHKWIQRFHWFLGVTIIGAAGAALLWFYALPQKARLPESFAPARYAQPIDIGAEFLGWLTGTFANLQYLYWGNEGAFLHWLTGILFVLGVVISFGESKRRRIALYLIMSLVVAYVASGIGFFVYAARYVWYAFSLSTVLISLPITVFVRRRSRIINATSLSLSLLLVGTLIYKLPMVAGILPPETEQMAQAVLYMKTHRQSDDAVYVYYGAKPAFLVYADELALAHSTVENWGRNLSVEEHQTQLWDAVSGQPRVWLLMSHVHQNEGYIWVDFLNGRCRPLDSVILVGAEVHLFDCNG